MTPPERLTLCVTGAFERDWRKARSELRRAALGSIGDVLARMAAHEPWGDRIQGVPKSRGTFEGVDVGGANRLVVKSSESPPVLFALGGHETKKTFQARLGERESSGRFHPPPQIQALVDAANSNGLKLPLVDAGSPQLVQRWAPEQVPAHWLSFLDDQQCAARDAIEDDLIRLYLGEGWNGAAHVLVGGPGTGKTVVLLEALRLAQAFGGETGRGSLKVRLSISDALREQIESLTGKDLSAVCDSHEWESEKDAAVVLVDDPASLRSLTRWLSLSRKKGTSGKRPLVVVAVDPLQMQEWEPAPGGRDPAEGVTDAAFFGTIVNALGLKATDGLVEALPRNVHVFTTCYRQKEKLGQVSYAAAKNILERSSPFAAPHKITTYREERRGIAALCNDAAFPNPSGWVGQHRRATFRQWQRYLEYVREQLERDRADGSLPPGPALLVVASADVPDGWTGELVGIPHVLCEGWYESQIKGLEYNHAAVILWDEELAALTDEATGIGPKTFDDSIRPLRIALSRARDSLGIFGVEA